MGNLAYPGFLVVFTLIGLVLAYFVLGESVSLLREIIQQMRPIRAPRPRRGALRSKHDTGPLNPNHVIPPFEDRKTVERLITYFEEEGEGSTEEQP